MAVLLFVSDPIFFRMSFTLFILIIIPYGGHFRKKKTGAMLLASSPFSYYLYWFQVSQSAVSAASSVSFCSLILFLTALFVDWIAS